MSKSLDGVLIKKAHQKESFTNDEILEYAKCVDSATGPLYFLKNHFHIQHPVQGQIKYDPYEYQQKLLDTYHNYRFNINMLPRQTGKTTTAAGYLLWRAMFVPDSIILIAAHKYAGAQEIMQRIRYAYELCPNSIRAGVISYNKGSIEFENGSRIIAQATTENTGRGLSISLLYSDEFAFVRPTIAKEFWTSISPTLATGGSAIITSTPNSDEDQFAIIWRDANKNFDEHGHELPGAVGVNGFKAYRSYWHEHPDRDEQWKKDELGRIGEERFRREHDCEFIINDETLVDSLVLTGMRGEDPISKQGTVRWYANPKQGMTYLVALDPSLGTGGDPAAIQVLEVPSMIQVAEWRHNKTPIPQQIQIMRQIITFIVEDTQDANSVYYSVENNSIGEAALVTIAEIGEEAIPGVFLSETRTHGNSKQFRKGFNTTQRSKITACSKLKTLVESSRLKVNSKLLVSELKCFVASGGSYAAKTGETDDLVMSLILSLRMANELKNYLPELDTQMSDGSDYDMQPMPFVIM
jgi:hypothetical protein